jgi:hypothetical protein
VHEFGLQFEAEGIQALAERFEFASDEAATRAGEQAQARACYTKSEFMIVCRWKSARNAWRAAVNKPAAIRRATATALAANGEDERMRALTSLEGVGVPVASALLHFAFPERNPILDYRALESLAYTSTRTTYSTAFWLSYLEACRRIAHENGATIRTLDKPLSQHSKERGRAPRPPSTDEESPLMWLSGTDALGPRGS